MNMITRIEPVEPVSKRRFRDLPLWQRVSAFVLPIAAIGAGVGLFNREAPALAAPPPPNTSTSTPPAISSSISGGFFLAPSSGAPSPSGAAPSAGASFGFFLNNTGAPPASPR